MDANILKNGVIMKKKKIYFMIFVCVSVLIVGCNTDKEDKKINYGISPFPDTYMPYLGKIKGWYAEEGLSVDFKILGWTEIQEALSSSANDRIDLGINNISSIVATNHKNPELIFYYGNNTFDNGFALMMRSNGKLKSLEQFINSGLSENEAIKKVGKQLKGKTIITTANTDMEQGVAALAKKGELDFQKDIKIINLNPDDGLLAFLSGTGDAYIGGIPQRNKATEHGMTEMITGFSLGPPPINGIVTTKSFIENNEESLLKILKVWFKIVNYTNDNLDEVAELMISELNKKTGSSMKASDFKKFWNNYEHYPNSLEAINNEILSPEGKNYWKHRWDDCNKYFYSIKKVIPKPVEAEKIFIMPVTQKKISSLFRE